MRVDFVGVDFMGVDFVGVDLMGGSRCRCVSAVPMVKPQMSSARKYIYTPSRAQCSEQACASTPSRAQCSITSVCIV